MKIKKVSAKNLKRTEFSFDLAPITVIYSEQNAVGKSAVADAIRLAALGYDLRLGKRSSDTGKLFSGAHGFASIQFDDGSENRLTLIKKGKSSSVQFDEAVKFPPVLLDIKEFFDRTGPERKKFLFGLAAKDIQFSVEQLVADLKNVRVEENTEATENAIADLCEFVASSYDESVNIKSQRLDEWFAALIDAVNKKISEANGARTMLKNSVQAAAANEAAQGLAETPKDCTAEIAALENEMQVLAKLSERIAERCREVHNANTEFEVVKNQLDSLPELSEFDDSAVNAAKEKMDAAQKAFDATFDIHAAEKKVMDAEITRQDLKQSIVQVEAEIKQYSALNGHLCAHCGATREHWSADVIAQRNVTLETARGRLANLNAAYADAEKLVKDLQKIVTDYDAAKSTYQDARENWTTRRSEQLDHLAKNEGLKANRAGLQARLNGMKEQPTQEDLLVEFEKYFADEGLKLADFMVEDSPAPHFTTGLENRSRQISAQIKALRQKHESFVEARALKKRQAEQAKQLADAEQVFEVMKAAQKMLEGNQTALIENGISAFVKKAGRFLQAVLGRTLEFKDGELGYWRDEFWVSHETFSGAEQVLAYVGLSLAFAQETPCRFIIIDELGRLGVESKFKLFSALELMVEADEIDNFIGIDVAEPNPVCMPSGLFGSEKFSIITIN